MWIQYPFPYQRPPKEQSFGRVHVLDQNAGSPRGSKAGQDLQFPCKVFIPFLKAGIEKLNDLPA